MELIKFSPRRPFRKSESRNVTKTPWHEWVLLADAALANGDVRTAIEMTRFAYWAADAALTSV
jgi:hypothetical protein